MELSRQRRRIITAAVLSGIFLAATEATIVATAMPTIVGRLGGVELYAWVFTAYFLTSSTTVPIFGKLADIFGRRLVYTGAVGIFVLGSVLCGLSGTMEQLVLFRAIQGIGAGGVQPLALTIVGDIYTLEERARIQGVFSAVWGVASIIAPAIGALIVENMAWQWVFFLNVPFGFASAGLVWFYLKDPVRAATRPAIDWLGAGTLIAGVATFQFALLAGADAGFGSPTTLGLFAVVAALTACFFFVERRATDPLIPFSLFRNRIIRYSTIGAFTLGIVVFGQPTFIPVLVQAARGGSAADAGLALIPQSIGWTIGAVIAGRTILSIGYRWTSTIGTVAVAIGSILLAVMPTGNWMFFLMTLTLIGIGSGFGFSAFNISSQNAVEWQRRGVATSTVQFARTIGGTLGVAILGAVFTAGIANAVRDVPGASVDIANRLLDARERATLPPELVAAVSGAIGEALIPVFTILAVFSVICILPSLAMPSGSARHHSVPRPVPAEEAPVS